ncbi:hypothetical protein A4H97_25215 [Niastella yeongjuensis]|uniref:Uncharacterized protein n=1 Tax=Niastella yeongjuensis TaxID=354355 RepID=A0A1V9F2Y1_9BACT|nr:hypothetical protein [Niastella yeongjuensis]OQP52626.1 hypothetical protein A4H97_25215 [Niastella yeongjuensis]SEP33489.1 hypothetical protein SAMN05660816_05309 [Niastella yeongjuensis]
MGLFNIFKKKDSPETLYSYISRYNEYIVRFITMQQQGNYAPIAAYEKETGDIVGFLYLSSEDNSYTLSAGEAIEKMEKRFEQQLTRDEISSYTIFYHSQFSNDDNHRIAIADEELKAISIAYNFKNGPAGKIGLPYRFDNDGASYQPIAVFDQEENNAIFTTQLRQGVNYFQHTELVEAPVTENPIGLKIKKSNNLHLDNTWCGIYGFVSYRKPDGGKVLEEHFKSAVMDLMLNKQMKKEGIVVSAIDFDDSSFVTVIQNERPKTILPVIKTDYIVPVENKEINEWENTNNLEAVITGSGRDTFGVSYFATDYAVNRDQYLSQKKLNIKLSGILFVLDTYEGNNDPEVPLADDFCGYFPSKDLPAYGCFDFIGILEDFKETTYSRFNPAKAYLLKVRLINHPDAKDFFTIDMFVNPENMRVTALAKGMRISGMFQLQGRIA